MPNPVTQRPVTSPGAQAEQVILSGFATGHEPPNSPLAAARLQNEEARRWRHKEGPIDPDQGALIGRWEGTAFKPYAAGQFLGGVPVAERAWSGHEGQWGLGVGGGYSRSRSRGSRASHDDVIQYDHRYDQIPGRSAMINQLTGVEEQRGREGCYWEDDSRGQGFSGGGHAGFAAPGDRVSVRKRVREEDPIRSFAGVPGDVEEAYAERKLAGWFGRDEPPLRSTRYDDSGGQGADCMQCHNLSRQQQGLDSVAQGEGDVYDEDEGDVPRAWRVKKKRGVMVVVAAPDGGTPEGAPAAAGAAAGGGALGAVARGATAAGGAGGVAAAEEEEVSRGLYLRRAPEQQQLLPREGQPQEMQRRSRVREVVPGAAHQGGGVDHAFDRQQQQQQGCVDPEGEVRGFSSFTSNNRQREQQRQSEQQQDEVGREDGGGS